MRQEIRSKRVRRELNDGRPVGISSFLKAHESLAPLRYMNVAAADRGPLGYATGLYAMAPHSVMSSEGERPMQSPGLWIRSDVAGLLDSGPLMAVHKLALAARLIFFGLHDSATARTP